MRYRLLASYGCLIMLICIPYEEICGHLLLLLDMAKLAAETIMSTHFPLI